MTHILVLAWLVLALCVQGCAVFTRTIYVPDGTAVRLRQTVKNAKVWVKEKNGATAEGRLNIPEGWYCKPLPQD